MYPFGPLGPLGPSLPIGPGIPMSAKNSKFKNINSIVVSMEKHKLPLS